MNTVEMVGLELCLSVWKLFSVNFAVGEYIWLVLPPIVDSLERLNGLLRLGTRSKKCKT